MHIIFYEYSPDEIVYEGHTRYVSEKDLIAIMRSEYVVCDQTYTLILDDLEFSNISMDLATALVFLCYSYGRLPLEFISDKMKAIYN